MDGMDEMDVLNYIQNMMASQASQAELNEVTSDGNLRVPLPFYCRECHKEQSLPYVMFRSCAFACHRDCNEFTSWYQNKVYFVRLSEIKLSSKLQLEFDQKWHDLYHEMQIVYEQQAIRVHGKKSKKKDEKEKKEEEVEKAYVFQVPDVVIASHGAIPRFIKFEITERKKGHGDTTSYTAQQSVVEPKYYREDGEEHGEFRVALQGKDKVVVGHISARIYVIGITPHVFRFDDIFHLTQSDAENWYARSYQAEAEDVEDEDVVAGASETASSKYISVRVQQQSSSWVDSPVRAERDPDQKMLRWIYNNQAVLCSIAEKLKSTDHEWSANDFSDVEEVNIKESNILDWFDAFRTYYTQNKHSFLLLQIHGENGDDVHLFETTHEVEQNYLSDIVGRNATKGRCAFDLHNVNDAICMLVRYQYLTKTLFTGFDDEFNIYRSYCFDRRTEHKSLKLVLSAFTLFLQITMTVAMYSEVIHQWTVKDWNATDSNVLMFVAAMVLFFYSSYLTNITVKKAYKWYLYFSRICHVSLVVVLFDFISNCFIPIAIAAISFFWLFASENLADIVLNSFALLFVYCMDDVVNTFEKDEEYLLKEDAFLFAAALRAHKTKTVIRVVANSRCNFLSKSLLFEVLLAFPMNIYHFFKFAAFLPGYASKRS